MDPIFKNKTGLKKEYQNLHTNILPTLNNCGNCNNFKCEYCLKFSVNCSSCIKKWCGYCVDFNKSKEILLNCGDFQIERYVGNFLVDYFGVNDLTKQFFKMDISEEVQKNPFVHLWWKNKKYMALQWIIHKWKNSMWFKRPQRLLLFKKVIIVWFFLWF